MRPFKVFTYYLPVQGKPPLKSRISAYTQWANESWPGCVVYEVEAESGAMAKVRARDMRLAAELEKKP